MRNAIAAFVKIVLTGSSLLLGTVLTVVSASAGFAARLGIGAVAATAGIAVAATNSALQGLIKSRLALAALASALSVALPIVAATLIVANPLLEAELSYAHDRSSATMLFDGAGNRLGVVPPNSFADWSDGVRLAPDHVAAIPTSIPKVWRACLVRLEDRSFDNVSGLLGVDPIQMLKSVYQNITGERRRGASTLMMQIARTLDGRTPDQREPIGDLLIRKVAEVFGANALATMMASGDPTMADRYLAMHLPLVIGAHGSGFGDPIDGIVIASHVLFGKDPSELSDAEQAIFAAAVKRPILMAPPGDAAGAQRAAARWLRVKERAEFCLRDVFADNPAALGAALGDLHDLNLPSPQIEAELRPHLPADPKLAWRILVNPIRRARYFSQRELRELKPEIARMFSRDWRGQVASVRLTTSTVDNMKFAGLVKDVLRDEQQRISGLDLDLSGPYRDHSADVYATLVDPAGRVVRFFESRPGFWLRKMGIASTAKLAAAAVLGRTDAPGTLYCRAPIPKSFSEIEPDAKTCRTAPRLSAQEAFARSDSEAVFWALLSRPGALAVAQKIVAALHLEVAGISPASILALGLAEQTPAEQMRTERAIAEGFIGHDAVVGLPRFVDSMAHEAAQVRARLDA